MTNRTLIHHSPLGALEIPGVLGPVEAGVPFTVDAAIADSLLEQADLFTTAPSTSAKAASSKGDTQ